VDINGCLKMKLEDWIKSENRMMLFRTVLVFQFGFDMNHTLDIVEDSNGYLGRAGRKGKETDFRIIEITYSDNHFRWNKGDFDKGTDLILQLSPTYIRMFDSKKMKEYLLTIREDISVSSCKTKFATKFENVSKLVSEVRISKLKEEEELWD